MTETHPLPHPKGRNHPDGCAYCPAELVVPRDSLGDPLCQTCPHRREESA